MFSLFNGIYDSYLAPTQLNLLVVGAPESGKTTLLERLKATEIPTHPRKGRRSTKNDQKGIVADEPPSSLKAALFETGAMTGRPRNRTLSKTSVTSGCSSLVASVQSLQTQTKTQTQTPSPPVVDSSTTTEPSSGVQTTGTGTALVVKQQQQQQQKRFSFCPAPKRYAQSSLQQDEDDDEEYILDEETGQLLLGGGGDAAQNDSILREDSFSSNTIPPQRVRCHSKEMCVETLDLMPDDGDDNDGMIDENNGRMSMRSIGMDIDHPISIVTNKALRPATATSSQPLSPLVPLHRQEQPQNNNTNTNLGPALLQSSPEEYNLKPNAKMLPLRMIRPTIGTNLAKIDMYGAKCHIFDVGGMLQDLWERYYDDCDAVIFCWKLGEDPDKPPKEPDSDDDSDEDDDEETTHERIYKKQQELLDTVRRSIPDDVPFLILGHVFGKANSQIVDTMYNTDLLLPRYHNPMTGFCCSSAKTGAGVQSAMEWLIPLAKRQQKERIASKRELDMMLEEQGKTL